MLREFHALPTEERVGKLKDRDVLWCALNLMLDDEEEVERLCPACRARAEREHCPACGRETGGMERLENEGFDWETYLRLKGGERA